MSRTADGTRNRANISLYLRRRRTRRCTILDIMCIPDQRPERGQKGSGEMLKYQIINDKKYTTDEIIIYSYLLNWHIGDTRALRNCKSDEYDIAVYLKGSIQMTNRLMKMATEYARRLRKGEACTLQSSYEDLPYVMYEFANQQCRKAESVTASPNVAGAIDMCKRFGKMCCRLWFDETFAGFESITEFFENLEQAEQKDYEYMLRRRRKKLNVYKLE